MIIGTDDLYGAPALILKSQTLFGRQYTLFRNPVRQNGLLRLQTRIGKDDYFGEGNTLQECFDNLLRDFTRVFGFEFWLIKKAFDLRLDAETTEALGIRDEADAE